MAKPPKPDENVAKLRQADVLISQGQSVAGAVRALGVSSVTYDQCRREFGGLKPHQAQRMKDLETENARLRNGAKLLRRGYGHRSLQIPDAGKRYAGGRAIGRRAGLGLASPNQSAVEDHIRDAN